MTSRVEERMTDRMLTRERHLPGFTDPVQDGQRVFRTVLAALSRPTLPQPLFPGTKSPAPLAAGLGAVLLALCDEQTPIWLDGALRASDDVCAWLRFHTGARLVDAPGMHCSPWHPRQPPRRSLQISHPERTRSHTARRLS